MSARSRCSRLPFIYHDFWRNPVGFFAHETWRSLQTFQASQKTLHCCFSLGYWATCLYVFLSELYLRITCFTHDFYSVFVSGTFVPSIPQIAKDLHSTGPIVRYRNNSFLQFFAQESMHSLAVSLSILASSFGALLGSSYSSFCKNPDPFPDCVLLTDLKTRWQETNLPHWDTPSLHRLPWGFHLAKYHAVDGMEIRPGSRSLTWFSSGVRGPWRYL